MYIIYILGIGKAILESFVKDGAKIMIFSRNEHELVMIKDEMANKYQNHNIIFKKGS